MISVAHLQGCKNCQIVDIFISLFIFIYMDKARKQVVIGILGTRLDSGKNESRWNHWRPTVALCQHEELLVHRLELIHQPQERELAELLAADVHSVSPESEVRL